MSEADLVQILERDTLDYQNLYDRTFTRIKSQSPAEKMLALRAMSWVAKAKRPLFVDELCHALAMQYSGQTFSKIHLRPLNIIQRACLGLLTVKSEIAPKEDRSLVRELSADIEALSDKNPTLKQIQTLRNIPKDDVDRRSVRFIHFTLLEYLEKNEVLEINDKNMIQMSWRYMSIPNFESDLQGVMRVYLWSDKPALQFLTHELQQNPFGWYALEYWKQHVDESTQQWPELLDHLFKTQSWMVWVYLRSAPERDSGFENKDWNFVRACLSMITDHEWIENHTLACLTLSICHDWTSTLQLLLASSTCGLSKVYKYLHILSNIAIQVGRLECLQIILEAYGFLVSSHSPSVSNLSLEQQKRWRSANRFFMIDTGTEVSQSMPALRIQMIESLLNTKMSWCRLIRSFEQFQTILDALMSCSIDTSSANAENETILHAVAYNDNQPHVTNDTDFATPLKDPDTERLRRTFILLLTSGADPNLQNSDGLTPFHYVLRTMYAVQIVSLFLENGADVNLRDQFGNTPLHFAVANYQSADVIDVIIAHGADINTRNDQGQTVLHRALWINRAITDHLLNHGAQNLPDANGITAFHIVMQWNFASNLFVRLGNSIPDINVPDSRGDTPILFLATWFDHQSTYGRKTKASFLLQHNDTNLNAQNMFSNTALHVAVKRYLLSFDQYRPMQADELVVSSNNKSLSGSDQIDYLDFIRQLVGHKASLNIKDSQGDTIAHLVTKKSPRRELIEAVGSEAINLDIQNMSGVSVRAQIESLPRLTQPWVLAFLLRKHWYDDKLKRWHIVGSEESQLAPSASKKLREA